MSFVEDLEKKVKDYLDGDYEIINAREIPSVENVAFGKKAIKMDLCVLCIDLRKSTELMFIHEKETSGKIHKAFLTIVSQVVLRNKGRIRSFQGDSLLAFWTANKKSDIDNAVKTAMTIKWLLDIKLSSLFEQYQKIDFGIGIDWGEVYILRAGISRDANNNDLVFIGKCVNFAVAIANQAESPKHVEISSSTYENLTDDWKYGEKNGKSVNIWKDCSFPWKGSEYKTKTTSWYNHF